MYSFGVAVAHRDGGGIVSLAIHRCRKITIAAVNGHAVGVGVTAFQLPFDFRFVWGGAKIALPFVRRGIAPEGQYTSIPFFALLLLRLFLAQILTEPST